MKKEEQQKEQKIGASIIQSPAPYESYMQYLMTDTKIIPADP